jgi:hypothetical protein
MVPAVKIAGAPKNSFELAANSRIVETTRAPKR